jgi:hypothetical protein
MEEDEDDLTDDDESGDEIEKIMEQGEINQEKLRNQLLFGKFFSGSPPR